MKEQKLLKAIDNNDFIKVKELLGNNINISLFDNRNLLTYSPSLNLEIVKYLVKKGVDINSSSINGLTPLIWNIIHENWDVVEYLCVLGADINRIDIYNKQAKDYFENICKYNKIQDYDKIKKLLTNTELEFGD